MSNSDSEQHYPTWHEQENARLQRELDAVRAEAQALSLDCSNRLSEARTGNAKVIHALDTAIMFIEALLAWLPEGLPMNPGLASAKHRLDEALKDIRRK